jgi:hypothetical protein
LCPRHSRRWFVWEDNNMSDKQSIRFTSKNHGTYEATPLALDAAIAKYLPASPLTLRRILEYRAPEIDWADVRDVSAALVILADWDSA